MTTQQPVVVIGAGSAGIAAALAAARRTPTVLIDEGQIGHDREALTTTGVEVHAGTAVWGLFGGPRVAALDDAGTLLLDAGAVVVATGGVDRTWPVPGWHLPGVMTASEIGAGGLRYGVIGSGDHVDEATVAIEGAGGMVAAVVEDPAMAVIGGHGRVERLGDVAVDRVVLAFGRRPDPQLVLQGRAAGAFLRDALVTMPMLAADGATSLPGVFVAGGAAGVTGVDAARAHGSAVGDAVARVAGGESQSTDLRAPAVAAAPLPLPADPATIVCREQGVALATVRAAIVAGAWDVNDLRRRTRAGMGPRGSREAMPVLAAMLLAADPAIPDARLIARERPPARPLPFGAVVEECGS